MKCPFCQKRCRRLRPTESHYKIEPNFGCTCDRHTTTIIISVTHTKLYLRNKDKNTHGVSRYISSICAHWINQKGQPFVAYFDLEDTNAYGKDDYLTVYRIDPAREIQEDSYSRSDPYILVLEMKHCPKEITPDNINRKVASLAIFA
jgi:hypothetical protein